LSELAVSVAEEGNWLNVITTSSVDVHEPFVMVQRKVYVFPATPEKLEIGLDAVVIEPPVPLTMLHDPVPTLGVLPANGIEVNPQVVAPV
jgi:hypothetical protein